VGALRYLPVIARSEATKQSIVLTRRYGLQSGAHRRLVVAKMAERENSSRSRGGIDIARSVLRDIKL